MIGRFGTGRPRRLRTQLSLSMTLTAVTALVIFISGMVVFYAYLQESWIDGLHEDNRRTLAALIENERIDPEALTTLVSAFSLSWSEGYATKEITMLILFVMIAVICSIIIGIFVARRISKPIETVTDAALKVAGGSLNFQVRHERGASIEAHDLLQTFNKMTRSLEQAERETAASAAAIAHELRTPLTILRGRLQGLSDGAFEPSQEMLGALIGQVDTLARIIDDLATLSRLTAGQYVPKTALTDLAEEVHTVLTGFAPDLEKEGFTLIQSLEPAITQADPARIRQALSALIENARRYAISGKYIRVETFLKNGHACLKVIDHGPGIAAEDHGRVFDRWWRAETSRTRAEGGSGLGLSVVKAIVLAHDGSVEVSDNVTGSGAVFLIELPVKS